MLFSGEDDSFTGGLLLCSVTGVDFPLGEDSLAGGKTPSCLPSALHFFGLSFEATPHLGSHKEDFLQTLSGEDFFDFSDLLDGL